MRSQGYLPYGTANHEPNNVTSCSVGHSPRIAAWEHPTNLLLLQVLLNI